MNKDLNHFFGGCVGGFTGTFFSHPFDTIRVRLQTHKPIITKNNYNNFSIKKYGFIAKDLYKGLTAPLFGIALEKTIVFGTYNKIYNSLKDNDKYKNNDIFNNFSAGIGAGVVCTIFVTPVEKIKINFQNNRVNNMKECFNILKNGNNNCLINVYKNLYNGWTSTLFREVPGYGIYFTTYHLQKKYLFNNSPNAIQTIFSGALCGAISWLFIYPADIVKTNKQDSTLSYKQIIKNIYTKEKIFGFYKGMGLSLFRAVPLHSGVFLGYEMYLKFVDKFI